jgi:hypothetical protein
MKYWIKPPTVDEVLQEVEAYARARAIGEKTDPRQLHEFLRDALSRAWCSGNAEGQPDYPHDKYPEMNPYREKNE